MTRTHRVRTAIAAAGLALAALTSPAAAQTVVWPPPVVEEPVPIVQPAVWPCSQIASFSPASARPGQDVDIHIRPPSGRTFYGYTVTGVQFANGVPATFSNPAAHHYRARVPVGSVTGPLQVTCRSTITGGTWSIASATAFTPVSLTSTLTPTSTTLFVGNSTTVTTTLSHPAPEPITLTLAPQSAALSVLGLTAGASGTVTIPTGQQSASFSVGAHAAAASATVVVSGPSVVSSTLTVSVPTPRFRLTVADPDLDVHWGDSAAYSVQVASENGFAGTVTLNKSGSLPIGASAAPVSVSVPAGGSTTATFTVATSQSATELGPAGFTLRGQSPGVADHTRSLDLRVLPDEGAFSGLSWLTADSTCGSVTADVNGTNISFLGPFARTQAHTHLRYAWTPGCRGAVVMGTAAAQNAGWPVSIFNVGFDGAIADAPGSRHNLGTAAWDHNHFRVSPDGSFLIAVALGQNYHANLFNMLDLAQRPPMHAYSVAESLSASIVGDEIQAQPSGNSNDWVWTLP